jgi:hypothetical protein
MLLEGLMLAVSRSFGASAQLFRPWRVWYEGVSIDAKISRGDHRKKSDE